MSRPRNSYNQLEQAYLEVQYSTPLRGCQLDELVRQKARATILRAQRKTAPSILNVSLPFAPRKKKHTDIRYLRVRSISGNL
jgi:hypothetical protein